MSRPFDARWLGLRRRLLVVQLLSLLIVTVGGFSGWWLAQFMAGRATAQAQLASRQSQALSELSIALLESLPFGPDYVANTSLAAVRRHLREDHEGLRRFRRLLDRRLSELLLEGMRPEVHKELEEIRLLTLQTEALLRTVERQLPADAPPGASLPPGLLEATVHQPSLRALKGHSLVLNTLLQRLGALRDGHEREQAAALASGTRAMLLALLLAWAGGLLFAWRTSNRILRPLGLLEETMRGWAGREDLVPIDLASFRRAPREIASLATSFHQLGGRLAALVDRLEDLALSDSLTQVGNRRRFDQALQREWARLRHRGLPLSLLMIDVDHFKAYNDTYGHGEGDRCLMAVAAAIRAQGRRASDLTCRIGGEEFALLLPEIGLEDARCIAERVWLAVQALAIPHRALGAQGRVSVSVGLATAFPSDAAGPDSLQLLADRALYRRKRSMGRDGVCVADAPDPPGLPVSGAEAPCMESPGSPGGRSRQS